MNIFAEPVLPKPADIVPVEAPASSRPVPDDSDTCEPPDEGTTPAADLH